MGFIKADYLWSCQITKVIVVLCAVYWVVTSVTKLLTEVSIETVSLDRRLAVRAYFAEPFYEPGRTGPVDLRIISSV